MATVKADFDLYSCAQRRRTTDEYYKIFTSTMDTINANGDRAGLHPVVFKRHCGPMKDKEVLKTGKTLVELMEGEVTVVDAVATEAAKEAATGEYLVCLFLLLADDDRFGLLKTELDNIFLMGPRLSRVPNENKGTIQPHR